MYIREMGTQSLLDRKREIEIAIAIEDGLTTTLIAIGRTLISSPNLSKI